MNKMPRLKEKYINEVIVKMKNEFGYKNSLQVPRIEKVVLNVGVGKMLTDPKFSDSVTDNLITITGQRPVKTKAKKAISNFKIREGIVVGVVVSLRGTKMYEFLDKLISVTLPRIRDFRGLPRTAFDEKGNYTIGIKEHSVFPEISHQNVDKIHGLEVTIVSSAKNKKEGEKLLEFLGFPFKLD